MMSHVFPNLWSDLRSECERLADHDEAIRPWIDALVLSHDSMMQAVIALVAETLASSQITAMRLISEASAIRDGSDLAQDCGVDLYEARSRDQAAGGYAEIFLFSKGYRGLASYRLSRIAWRAGRHALARFLHYRTSEALGIDIHPAANVAAGIVIDHGTGLVIGESAVVGAGSYLFHGVTLGSTGHGTSDRHPKLEEDVFVGANATILGNVIIGKGSVVAAGSVVTKDVAPGVVVGGSPARMLGRAKSLLPRTNA